MTSTVSSSCADAVDAASAHATAIAAMRWRLIPGKSAKGVDRLVDAVGVDIQVRNQPQLRPRKNLHAFAFQMLLQRLDALRSDVYHHHVRLRALHLVACLAQSLGEPLG